MFSFNENDGREGKRDEEEVVGLFVQFRSACGNHTHADAHTMEANGALEGAQCLGFVEVRIDLFHSTDSQWLSYSLRICG